MIFAQELVDAERLRWVVPAAVALAVLVAMGVAFRMWRTARRRRRTAGEPLSLEINVDELGPAGPPSGGPAL